MFANYQQQHSYLARKLKPSFLLLVFTWAVRTLPLLEYTEKISMPTAHKQHANLWALWCHGNSWL